MIKIRNVKSEIKDLEITINKAITIQVLNFLNSSFMQFLSILSYEAREKNKLLTLKNRAKSLEDKKLQIKNYNKATANYAKQFIKEKSKSSIPQIENSENSAAGLSSKYKFCKKKT